MHARPSDDFENYVGCLNALGRVGVLSKNVHLVQFGRVKIMSVTALSYA